MAITSHKIAVIPGDGIGKEVVIERNDQTCAEKIKR